MNLIKKYNVYGTWKDRNVCKHDGCLEGLVFFN
jgi:hypothetical protein